MYNLVCGVFISVVFFTILVSPVAAAKQTPVTTANKERAALLLEIKQLQSKLDSILQQLAKTSVVTKEPVVSDKPYQLEFFDLSFTGEYFIKNGTIVPTVTGQKVAATDQELFTLFKGVVGETALKQYFKEWRTFNDEEGDLGGFVELIPKEKRWVIGVNQADVMYAGEDSLEAYVSLFVHEYAHVLLYEKPELVAQYKKQFWTKADVSNQKKLTRLAGDARFEASLAYYEQNSDRFVSDYATVSPDEDMAESFGAFILESRGVGNTTAITKQNFYYSDTDLSKVREMLRKNLASLGYL